MKKKRVIQINFSNRWLYTFIILGILAIVGVGVYAYGTSNPSTFGHSIGEIDFTGGFTVPSGDINLGDSGKVIIGTSTITSINRTTIKAQGLCLGTDCRNSWNNGIKIYQITNARCSGSGGITFSDKCTTDGCGGGCQSYYVYKYTCAGQCICATSGTISCDNTLKGYLVN